MWVVNWWRSIWSDGLVHGHDEGRPCNERCRPLQEVKREYRQRDREERIIRRLNRQRGIR